MLFIRFLPSFLLSCRVPSIHTLETLHTSRVTPTSLFLLFYFFSNFQRKSNIIMPRKEFLRDLADAAVPGRFSSISDVRTGDYDGSISFTFAAPAIGLIVDLQAIVSGKKQP